MQLKHFNLRQSSINRIREENPKVQQLPKEKKYHKICTLKIPLVEDAG